MSFWLMRNIDGISNGGLLGAMAAPLPISIHPIRASVGRKQSIQGPTATVAFRTWQAFAEVTLCDDVS